VTLRVAPERLNAIAICSKRRSIGPDLWNRCEIGAALSGRESFTNFYVTFVSDFKPATLGHSG